LWLLLCGAIQRPGRSVLTQAGGTHPNRVAEDEAKTTTNASQFSLRVQLA